MKLFCLLLLIVALVQADVSFDVAVDAPTVQKGDFFAFSVIGKWNPIEGDYKILKPSFPQLNGLSIGGHQVYSETLLLNSNLIKKTVHKFEMLVNNEAQKNRETGPIYINYKLGDETHTQMLESKVIKLTISKWKKYILLPFCLLLFLGFIVFIIRRKLKKRSLAKAKKRLPLENIEAPFIEQLPKIRHKLISGHLIEFYVALEELVSAYFHLKYKISNFEECLNNGCADVCLDKHTALTLKELVKTVRNVRFAGERPNANENDRIYEFINTMLKNNQPVASVDELYLNKE